MTNPWRNFLDARCEAIHYFRAEGKSCADVVAMLNLHDADQVAHIQRATRSRGVMPEQRQELAVQTAAQRTGRTTRMLAEARRLAILGDRVCVLSRDRDHATDMARRNPELVALGVVFESAPAATPEMLASFRPLVDHTAAEWYINTLLQVIDQWRTLAHEFDNATLPAGAPAGGA